MRKANGKSEEYAGTEEQQWADCDQRENDLRENGLRENGLRENRERTNGKRWNGERKNGERKNSERLPADDLDPYPTWPKIILVETRTDDGDVGGTAGSTTPEMSGGVPRRPARFRKLAALQSVDSRRKSWG